jgi:hypothetical protein
LPLRRYRPRAGRVITAVQLALDFAGFSYEKWGGRQQCKPGDWLVDNQGDVYTVDARVFARTYRRVGPGSYAKITPVWGERASAAGTVTTKEGVSRFVAGDYLVYNDEARRDGYCMSAQAFESLYEADD